MPIRDLIRVHTPTLTVHERAFSSEFRLFGPGEVQSVDRAYRHCSHATLGAIYDRDGAIIAKSLRDGGRHGDRVLELDPPRGIPHRDAHDRTFLPGRTLFLGHYMNRYGHFLVETMARFWSVATGRFDHYAFFPFTPDGGEIKTHDFHRLFLDHVGIAPDSIVILRSPVEFQEIHVPERLSTINHNANVELPAVYQDIADRHRERGGPARLFLSRLQPYHRIANVSEVEDVFRELDFTVIYPETLDLRSQIALYAGCRVLAGFAGSALHNGLFCQEGTALIELGDIRSSHESVPMQRVVNQAAGVEAHLVPYAGSSKGHLDTAGLRRWLLEISLLARRDIPPEYSADFASRSRAHHYPWPATLTAHIAGAGDTTRTGSLLLDALRGKPRPIEGIAIALDDGAPFGIEYRIRQSDGTWTDWSGPGTFLGARGTQKPILGYAVRLTGPGAAGYRCVCLGKFAGHVGLAEAADGEDCVGPDGAALVGLQIQLQRAAGRPRPVVENKSGRAGRKRGKIAVSV